MLRLALAKAAIGRYEAGEHRCDQFSRLDRHLRCLMRKNFRIGDEIAVKRRRQLNCEPNRLVVLDRAELEFRHPSLFSPKGLEHQVPVDDDPDREAGSDRDRRLDIERAPDDLLSDLVEALRGALAQSRGEGALVIVGAGFRTYAGSVERIAALNSML